MTWWLRRRLSLFRWRLLSRIRSAGVRSEIKKRGETVNPFETALDAKVREFNQVLDGLRALGLSDTRCMGEGDGNWHPVEPTLEREPEYAGRYSPTNRCRWCGLTPLTQKQRKKLIAASQSVKFEQDTRVYTHEAQVEHGTGLCQHRTEYPVWALQELTRRGDIGVAFTCNHKDGSACKEAREQLPETAPVRWY